MTSEQRLNQPTEFPDTEIKMPVLFVGHGNPMNAIEDNEFSRAWIIIGSVLPRPKAILCVSAHWETIGTQVTAMEKPKTIHDFYGFPQPLNQAEYPAPGSPALARIVQETVGKTKIEADHDWGLDHGTWSVLTRMFPHADVPVVQLSLDQTKDPAWHYALGKELKALRKKGVLILGSGNLVHNLRAVAWQDTAFDWATEFDQKVKDLILSGDHGALIRYPQLGQAASLAIPTNEHYLPLLYVLALQEQGEQIGFFAEKVTMGSISMRSLRIG